MNTQIQRKREDGVFTLGIEIHQAVKATNEVLAIVGVESESEQLLKQALEQLHQAQTLVGLAERALEREQV